MEEKSPAWQLTCTQMAAITMATLIANNIRIHSNGHFWAQAESFDIWIRRNKSTSRAPVLIALRSRCAFDRVGPSRQGPSRPARHSTHLSVVTGHDNNGCNSGLPSILRFCAAAVAAEGSSSMIEQEKVDGKEGRGRGQGQGGFVGAVRTLLLCPQHLLITGPAIIADACFQSGALTLSGGGDPV